MIINQNVIEVFRGTSCEVTVHLHNTTGLDDFIPYFTVKSHHSSSEKLIDLEADVFNLVAKVIIFNVPYEKNILLPNDYYFDVNIEHLYSLLEVNVSPADDWEKGDIIEGQTSGATCVIISKISATEYKIKDIVGTFQDAEIIGVTGEATKLADQTGTYPKLTKVPADGIYRRYPVVNGIYRIVKSVRYR